MRDLSHIKMLDGIEKVCGPVSLGKYTILFNSNHITKKEAIRIAEEDSYSPYVIVLPQEQFYALFYNSTPEDDSIYCL